LALNRKAQAAVSDALFLLLIVGVLSASLVAFSIQYGSTVQKYISTQYIIDFETTALKTILYSTIPRDEGKTVFDAPQVDYLLAVVKEDYLDDAKLSERTWNILRNASKIAVKPLNSSFDYLFFIQSTGLSKDFVFTYLNASPVEFGSPRIEYYCVAKDLRNVQAFLESVGAFSPVASGIKLSKINPETKNPETVSGIAELVVWPGTSLFKDDGLPLVNSIMDLKTINAEETELYEGQASVLKTFNDIQKPWCKPDAAGNCQGILVCKRIPQNQI